MIQNEETRLVMEAAKQKGEDMRNSVDALRRHLTQQVGTYQLTLAGVNIGIYIGKP